MPAVVPVVAAVAGAATAASSLGATLTLGLGLGFAGAMTAGSLAGFAVSAAVNQLGSRALSKRPKAAGLGGDAAGRAVTVRSSVESHKVVYGRARVSGPLVFAHTADRGPMPDGRWVTGDNAFLHLLIPVAGHEVAAIGDV